MVRVNATALVLGTLALSACSLSPQNEADTSPVETVLPRAANPTDTQDSNQEDSVSFWTFKDINGTTTAIYGYEASDAVFSVSCDDLAEELVFYRAANAPENSVINMNLLLPEGNTLLRATDTSWELPGYTGRMANTDPWLEQLAEADTLTVDLQGEDALTVAVSPKLKRVIASCK
ncbi:MAG: hypothetical protein ACTS2F_05320 [Thainema sp.]